MKAYDHETLLYLVAAQSCFLYEKAGEEDGSNHSEATDEIFSGWAVREVKVQEACRKEDPGSAEPGTGEGIWIYVVTHYGYRGYVRADHLRPVSREELVKRQHAPDSFLVGKAAADVLDRTRVQGEILETLLRGSIVELICDEKSVREQTTNEGWVFIRTAAGRTGYVHSHFLVSRMDDDAYLLEDDPDVFNRSADALIGSSEPERLRRALTDTARTYLGTQYRWAGKSALGIDCSGLTFMSYMFNGILLYRDAWIRREHPIREITRDQLKEGDLIFFDGHVAMYLGQDRYIHSTGLAADSCVTINSLDPEDPLFREDLPGKILWYGSVFEGARVTKTAEDEERIIRSRNQRCS